MGHVLLNVRVTVPAALAAATVVLAGCGSSQPAPRAAVAPELAASLFHDARYEADGRALFRARRVLVRRCMLRQGFAYHADDGAVPPPPDPELPGARDGYGLAAVVSAIPADAAGRRARPPRRRTRATSTRSRPSRRARLRAGAQRPAGSLASLAKRRLRVPHRGCYARAVARVEGSLRAYYGRLAVQNEVAAAVNESLHGDMALTRALESWRDCMREPGLPLPRARRGARRGL